MDIRVWKIGGGEVRMFHDGRSMVMVGVGGGEYGGGSVVSE